MGLFEMSERFQRLFDLEEGAYVAYIENGGTAADSGLPRNTVIVSVDGERVSEPEDVVRLLEEADGPALVEVVRRSGERAFFELR